MQKTYHISSVLLLFSANCCSCISTSDLQKSRNLGMMNLIRISPRLIYFLCFCFFFLFGEFLACFSLKLSFSPLLSESSESSEILSSSISLSSESFSNLKSASLSLSQAPIRIREPYYPPSAFSARPRDDPITTIQGLVSRLLPSEYLNKFLFIVVSERPDHIPYYIIEQNGDIIQISGNNAVSMASGLNYYLRTYCNVQLWTWSGSQLSTLPPADELPPILSRITIQSPYNFNYYQNVCTVSYSSVWWTWSRWEQEIDWMALNGINLPLAFTGQEKIWYEVWTQLGFNDTEIDSFLVGPAFLAWGRMGNLQGWIHSLPNSWIQGQFFLQSQILSRMRSFGMHPVLPAYAGFVPLSFSLHYPNINYTLLPAWNNFPYPYSNVAVLAPDSPMFEQIGNLFLSKMIEYWGTDHYYNCDTFNENDPTSSDPIYLSNLGKAVYNGMLAVDIDSIWIMQGWLFLSSFWKAPQVQALLSGIPNDRMIILDLFSDVEPLWQKFDSYYGKPFIWCMLHDFGGNLGLYGRIDYIASSPVLSSKAILGNSTTMIGTGLTMEGINQNYIMYELMNDMFWTNITLNPNVWIINYVSRRYGVSSDPNTNLQQAWQILHRNNYNWSDITQHGPWRGRVEFRPSLSAIQPPWSAAQVQNALKLFIAAIPQIKDLSSDTPFVYDLIDILRQCMNDLFSVYHAALVNAFTAGDKIAFAQASQSLLQLILDLDTLLSTNTNYLLGAFISDARAWASSSAESDYYEWNCRNQLTLWGPNGEITDYAGKQWNGLMGSYYYNRWQLLVSTLNNCLQTGSPFNSDQFNKDCLALEENWQKDFSTIFPSTAQGNAIQTVQIFYNKYFAQQNDAPIQMMTQSMQ